MYNYNYTRRIHSKCDAERHPRQDQPPSATGHYSEIINLTGSSVESIWINIKNDKKSLAIGMMYRHPSSNVAYFNAILDQVDQIYTNHDNVILLGDLNYNYVSNQSLMTSPLYQLETMYGMTQLVCEPTRVTVNTATLLDVIFSTNYHSHSVTGVYKIGLSDHYMVYKIYLMTTVTQIRPEKVIRFRNYRNFSIESFRNDILSSEYVRDIDWTSDMLQTKWDEFKNAFLTLSDKHAPMQTRKIKIQI